MKPKILSEETLAKLDKLSPKDRQRVLDMAARKIVAETMLKHMPSKTQPKKG